MRIYAPTFALLFLLPLNMRAQSASGDPLANLNFDAGEAGKLPPDWFVVPNWTVAEVRRGPECRNGGCFTMTRPDPPPPDSFGNVMRTLPGKSHAGKRIVYRAAVRVEGDGTAAMWLRVDRPNRQIGLFDNMGSRPIRAGGWMVHEIQGIVDSDAERITFGVMANGKARVWVDDVTVESMHAEPDGPEKAAAREAITKLYRRLDEAMRAGRSGELLDVSLPEAMVGSAMRKMPMREYVAMVKAQLAEPGSSANGTTEITAFTLFGPEATSTVRMERSVTTAGKTQSFAATARDTWVRQSDDRWLLKDSTVLGARDVRPVIPPLTAKRVSEAIATRATPLTTAVAGAPLTDLAAFGKAVGDARIVSLGEATHGTREIFQMKHRLLEYLVKEKGFTVFAIEANWPESEAADRYITTGEGDPRKALQAMYFWTWQTEEVLAMIEWMRAFNQVPGRHPTLRFTAFDMQTHEVAAKRVTEFARRYGTGEDAAAVEKAYAELGTLPTNGQKNPAFRTAAEQADRVTALFASKRAAMEVKAGAAGFRDALQMTRIVSQAMRLYSPEASVSHRDEMMAKNIGWLAKEAHPGEKIVVWAHNGHIAKQSETAQFKPMGYWMREEFGPSLYVAGFAIHTGSVRAVGGGQQRTGLRAHAVPPAPAGSGTAVLSAAGKPLFFLDIGTAAREPGPLADWLRTAQLFRGCGALWNLDDDQTNMLDMTLSEGFDGLFYLEKTEAAKGLQ